MAIPCIEKLQPKDISKAAWFGICDAWSNGLSDREAAFRVSKKTGEEITYDYIRNLVHEDKKIASLRENLMSDLITDAKLNVADAVKGGDTATAKWLLERKAPEEFSTKSTVAFDEASKITLSIEDKEKALEEMIKNFENGE